MLAPQKLLAKISFDTVEHEPSKVWPAEDIGILGYCWRILRYWDARPPPEQTALHSLFFSVSAKTCDLPDRIWRGQ